MPVPSHRVRFSLDLAPESNRALVEREATDGVSRVKRIEAMVALYLEDPNIARQVDQRAVAQRRDATLARRRRSGRDTSDDS